MSRLPPEPDPPREARPRESSGRGPGRILIVSGLQIHPTLSGGTLRSHSLAIALKRAGYDVSVFSLTGRKPDYLARGRSSTQVWPDGVEEYVDRSLPSMARWIGSYVLGLPPLWLTAGLMTAVKSPGGTLLPRRLRRELASSDAVVADFPWVYPVLLAPVVRRPLRIVNTHNIEHRLFSDSGRWMDRRIRGAVRTVELKAAAACDVLVSCCEEDARFFGKSAPPRRSVVVPNGVDVRRFEDVASKRGETRRALGIGDGEKVFLFTASKWGPNHDAFEYLLDFARARERFLREERIHLLVVGSVTPTPLRLPGFTATGRVARTEPYFGAADAALNPVRSGTGTNLKTCEYLAARLPVVSTAFGARGFNIEHGKTGFLFEPDELGAALSMAGRMLDEEADRVREMVGRAYERNERAVDMSAAIQPLLEVLAEGRHPHDAA